MKNNAFNNLVLRALNDSDFYLSALLTTLREAEPAPENLASLLAATEAALTTDENNAAALFLRGRMHQYGHGGDIDYPAAIALLDRAIALNHADAMNNRAIIYLAGEGEADGTPNYPAAIALLDRATALNHALAMHNRALMHLRGEGEADGTPNYPAAIALLDRAIALNHAAAMHGRALMHLEGKGEADGTPNYPAAIALLDRAIALNQAGAMCERALMYSRGKGEADSKPNYPAAIALYVKSAEKGYDRALNSLISIAESENLSEAQYYLVLFYFKKNPPKPQEDTTDDVTTTPTYWFQKNPDVIADLIYDNIIAAFEYTPLADEAATQALLNFVLERDPRQTISPKTLHLQLKTFLYAGEDTEALEYYTAHETVLTPLLTANEYFRLGNTIFIAAHTKIGKKEKLITLKTAAQFLLQAHKKADPDAKVLLLRVLRQKEFIESDGKTNLTTAALFTRKDFRNDATKTADKALVTAFKQSLNL